MDVILPVIRPPREPAFPVLPQATPCVARGRPSVLDDVIKDSSGGIRHFLREFPEALLPGVMKGVTQRRLRRRAEENEEKAEKAGSRNGRARARASCALGRSLFHNRNVKHAA